MPLKNNTIYYTNSTTKFIIKGRSKFKFKDFRFLNIWIHEKNFVLENAKKNYSH